MGLGASSPYKRPTSTCLAMLPGSSGRGIDSGAGSGSGGEGEAEVGTPRASTRRLKGRRQRSNLGQPLIKASRQASHPRLELSHVALAKYLCQEAL